MFCFSLGAGFCSQTRNFENEQTCKTSNFRMFKTFEFAHVCLFGNGKRHYPARSGMAATLLKRSRAGPPLYLLHFALPFSTLLDFFFTVFFALFSLHMIPIHVWKERTHSSLSRKQHFQFQPESRSEISRDQQCERC